MPKPAQVVFDEWNAYVAERDDLLMFISFDVGATRSTRPSNLAWCARIMIPIREPGPAGGPGDEERDVLWQMEDALVAMLQKAGVRCRLVGRMTYDGLREIVFQVHDWESFRPPVGAWMGAFADYEIDVSEHEGWEFFDDHISPRLEDQLFMADRSVIDRLIESGSDPEKEHALEYAFRGPAAALERLGLALRERGYVSVDEQDDLIVLATRLPLDLRRVVAESIGNHRLAEEYGVECDGWGALIVK